MSRQGSSKRGWRDHAPTSSSLLRALVIATGLSASVPAGAQDSRARDLAGWTLAASEDGRGCFLSRHYDGVGNTTLLLGLDTDGTNRLSVLNDNWSITPKARLKLDFRLSGGGYIGNAAIGLASNGQKGFVTTFDAKFPGYFATSTALHVSRGDVPVAQLGLDGSGAAIAALRHCVDAHRGAKADSDATDRSDRIPKDPFAPGLPRRAKR